MKHKLALAIAAVLVVAPALVHAACPVGVTCDEYFGEGKKGSFFRISIPTTPAWDGDLVIINHGFDLDRDSIRPHGTCSGEPITSTCETSAECDTGHTCKLISYFGLDEGLMPQGKAVAASTYSQTGWSVFNSRKDLADILKFLKKELGVKPTRTIITGFSMGGAVTIDASLRMKGIDGIVPLCPAAGGALPTWDAATDLRMVYDYVCDGVSGGQFFEPPDVGFDGGEIPMALRVNTCLGVLFPDGDPGEAAAQAARLADLKTFTGHTGTDEELLTLMGFATIAVSDLYDEFKFGKLKGKRFGFNQGIVYPADPGVDAGIERLPYGKGRKKLAKNYLLDYTKGKGKKVDYPIVHIANTDDFLTIPGFQTVFQNALDLGGKDYTTAWVNGGSHCNFSEEEITAAMNTFFSWLDGGPQPTAADIEADCLAQPGGVAGDTCDFNLGFVGPPLTDRSPARPDWPAAAQ